MANEVLLGDSHPLTEDIYPLKVGGAVSSLEISKTGNGAKVSGDLEIAGDFVISGNIVGGVEYGWFKLDDAGTADANENNFGLGSTVTSTFHSPNISWDDTNKVIAISKTGAYEIVCNALISINYTYNTTLAIYINTAADTLGTSVHTGSFEIDSGDDPIPVSIRWMGNIANGEYIACTIDGGSRMPYFQTNSTLSIKSLTG